MSTHEHKTCPRCQKTFDCKAGAIHLCQCSAVELDDEERQYISGHFDDCLCADCLIAIKAAYKELDNKELVFKGLV